MAQSDQIWSKMLHIGGHHRYNAFLSPYMDCWDLLVLHRGFICSYIGLLGVPRGGLKVRKGASGASSVNIGQLDHYVVFGTKSGAIQDFQRGKKCPVGVKQTPLGTVAQNRGS